MRWKTGLLIGGVLTAVGGDLAWIATAHSAPHAFHPVSDAHFVGTALPRAAPVSYPSLSQTAARAPVASLSTIRANQGHPAVLGTLRWSTADGQLVQTLLGRRTASARTTRRYALTFLYAGLARNRSILNSPLVDGGGNGAMLLQNLPHQVSQVDQIVLEGVRPALSGPEYQYAVTYTTTAGSLHTRTVYVGLSQDPTRAHHWAVSGVSE